MSTKNDNDNDDENNNDEPQPQAKKKKRIVIAGAGIIGTSTAYYLTQNHNDHLSTLTLVDPTGTIAPAASGKAAGFLALNWNDHHLPTGRLARRSFALHEELAMEEGDGDGGFGTERIMYRRSTAASIRVVDDSINGRRRPSGKKLQGVEWAEGSSGGGAIGMAPLGDESTIAQVHPKMLCDAMWDAVAASKANTNVPTTLMQGRVIEAVYDQTDDDDDDGGKKILTGAKLEDGTILPADAILFACGPWTNPNNNNDNDGNDHDPYQMLGVKYHSAILPTDPLTLNQTVFFDGCGDPEVYPRPDATAYCTGFPDPPIVVTERPGQEEVRPDAVRTIVEAVRAASGGGGGDNGVLARDPIVEQSCYLPTTRDGLLVMGELLGSKGKGCFVAAGHGCWGILLGPGTGEAMASLMVEGRSTEYVDLEAFSPGRFGW